MAAVPWDSAREISGTARARAKVPLSLPLPGWTLLYDLPHWARRPRPNELCHSQPALCAARYAPARYAPLLTGGPPPVRAATTRFSLPLHGLWGERDLIGEDTNLPGLPAAPEQPDPTCEAAGVVSVLQKYLSALNAGSAQRAAACFTPDGVVHSPLYGTCSASDFYDELFEDSSPSTVEYRRTYIDPDNPREVALSFHYAWVLRDGTSAPFDVVDLITLSNDEDKIESLTICYDTAPLRASWQSVNVYRTEPGES